MTLYFSPPTHHRHIPLLENVLCGPASFILLALKHCFPRLFLFFSLEEKNEPFRSCKGWESEGNAIVNGEAIGHCMNDSFFFGEGNIGKWWEEGCDVSVGTKPEDTYVRRVIFAEIQK